MDRSYMAEDQIALFNTQADRESGLITAVTNLVPYSRHGFDYYVFQDGLYAGYVFRFDEPAFDKYDGYIILNQALKGIIE